jgi:hypothetical protein
MPSTVYRRSSLSTFGLVRGKIYGKMPMRLTEVVSNRCIFVRIVVDRILVPIFVSIMVNDALVL